ncbi:biotin--[acetyl-CoA-carboxylase] ligase [Leekyejoonella antrihumi]|uniref:biotin--[acetyl-CoA-carboxylase] ligase n=1 Tax=Leekyejoonella antrihumi TaxID=1660198 RepID=UPI001647A783|nr:biotin--[acetyl-CoA-carboxylase] ligase [Leekyejoonella antrihumi]
MSHFLDGGLLRQRLSTTTWHDTVVRSEVGSTNEELLIDPRPWRVLVADHQTTGRGRLERSWVAPAGTSIAMSASMPLPQDAGRWGWVPLLVGVAVRRALLQLTDLELGLKWPNDVLAREQPGREWRKIAGILCNATGGSHPVVVVGVGLNVHQTAAELPVDTATSLDLCGAHVSREDVVVAVLGALAEVEKGWDTATWDDRYRSACVTLGQEVRIQLSEGEVARGPAVDIDRMGRLVLQTPSGLVPHAVGDVVHVRREPTSTGGQAGRERSAGTMAPPARESQLDRAAFVDSLEARLMGYPRTMRRSDVGDAAQVSGDEASKFWRALGFANARDDDVVFSEADVQALSQVDKIVRDGLLDETTALGLARALGRTTDRMGMWSLQLVTDMVSGENIAEVDSQLAHVSAERVVDLAARLEPLLLYAFRRNLGVAISRLVADSEPETHIGVVRTVGFADLVSYTRLVRQLSERELGALVLRFEALAADVVSQHGGAVVKMVGDEVLFSHPNVEGAVNIAFDLLQAAELDDLMPQMRVGMAGGRVLARLGDIYGNTVNRASRLTTVAQPGTVLVDPGVAEQAQALPEVVATSVDPIELRGIGHMEPWVLTRQADAPEGRS